MQYLSQTNSKVSFEKYYEDIFLPKFQEMEQKRLRKRKQRQISIAIVLAASVACFILIALNQDNKFYFKYQSFIYFGPGIFLWWLFIYRPKRKYMKAMNQALVPLLISFLEDAGYSQMDYTAKAPVDKKLLKFHGLAGAVLPPYLPNTEDCITFNHKGVQISLFETIVFNSPYEPLNHFYIHLTFPQPLDQDMVMIGVAYPKHVPLRLRLKRKLKRRQDDSLQRKITCRHHLYTPENNIKVPSTAFFDFVRETEKSFGNKSIFFSIRENEVLFKLETNKDRFEVAKELNKPMGDKQLVQGVINDIEHVIAVAFEMVDVVPKIFSDTSATAN